MDNSTYAQAQIRAAFYPKFENEKSDKEIRKRMIEMVSEGLAVVEVTLKHSGSLFMYAGNGVGSYAKNSFRNKYTAVGVFVLCRMFQESWGTEAATTKQAEFSDFLENNRMCISMELVTAVLGDHGQRPKEDYVVVTAVTDLGEGKPKFYSTPEVIAFCRKWRLPTNHVWLFSTKESVECFFDAFDTHCEEGTATTVCRALDEALDRDSDISVPGSKDHIEVQGEILEGLVARIVSPDCLKRMEEVLRENPPPPAEGGVKEKYQQDIRKKSKPMIANEPKRSLCLTKYAGVELRPSLREIWAADYTDEKQQIEAVLQSVASFSLDISDWFRTDGDVTVPGREIKNILNTQSGNANESVFSKFLLSHSADSSTAKLQEMITLMEGLPVDFRCYPNSPENDSFKMVIHVKNDKGFQKYKEKMRKHQGSWPLYRGFFIEINLKAHLDAEIGKQSKHMNKTVSDDGLVDRERTATRDDFSDDDDDANLMIKLKFLKYKTRTFLIRNGLLTLFKKGPSAYEKYYLGEMKKWGTSERKKTELSKMLDEWANHIRSKYEEEELPSSTYLSEAEPFLEEYASRNTENVAAPIVSAGSSVRAEEAITEDKDDLQTEREVAPQ